MPIGLPPKVQAKAVETRGKFEPQVHDSAHVNRWAMTLGSVATGLAAFIILVAGDGLAAAMVLASTAMVIAMIVFSNTADDAHRDSE